MDWNFLIFLGVFALWPTLFVMVTNAQINGTFSATRTIDYSNISINATTVFSSLHATRTVGYSNILVKASTVLPPSIGPKIEGENDSKFGFLIIGFIVAVMCTFIFVSIVTLLHKLRKTRPRRGSDSIYGRAGVSHTVHQSHAGPSGELGRPSRLRTKEDFIPKERHSRTVSKHANLVKKIITTAGGEIRNDNFTLNIGDGCLAKDTEITMKKDDKNLAFKTLHVLNLVDAVPSVVEFLPDGLEFLKPADLTIRVGKTISTNSELFIFHGSYNHEYQRIVWNQVTNDIEESRVEGIIKMKIKIKGFSFYSFLMTGRGKIARLLSHLNDSFSCCAYVLYRRLPSMDTIDISAVFVSEFVVDDNEENIEQLKILHEAGYTKGEKGTFKILHTNRPLELSLEFPGVKPVPILVAVQNTELDGSGFVVDNFQVIHVKKPASGKVRISEVHPRAKNRISEVHPRAENKISEVRPKVKNKFLWLLNVREVISEKIDNEEVIEQSTEPDVEPAVVYRTTKLTSSEISRVSRCLGVYWDSLAGLLDIPYSVREEIRSNDRKYPDSYSKAAQILERFNCRRDFCRHILKKCFEELGREDLKNELRREENQIESETEEPTTKTQLSSSENVLLESTPLSSREMYMLSRHITVEWWLLAGLMGMLRGEINDILQNTMYKDHRDRAEKILSLYNCKKNFSRQQLAKYLKEIGKNDLIDPIKSGQWRKLIVQI